jgi:hypothetical protein
MSNSQEEQSAGARAEARWAQEKAWLDKLASAARMYKQHESGETRAELRFAYRDALLAIAMDAP